MTKKIEPRDRQAPRWVRNADLARYLNVSAMCIWRWQRDPALSFPQPSVVGTVSYTDLNHVDQWMRDRVTKLAARTQ